VFGKEGDVVVTCLRNRGHEKFPKPPS
jgi:hypothetical protein